MSLMDRSEQMITQVVLTRLKTGSRIEYRFEEKNGVPFKKIGNYVQKVMKGWSISKVMV
jgi:hypothetical protein